MLELYQAWAPTAMWGAWVFDLSETYGGRLLSDCLPNYSFYGLTTLMLPQSRAALSRCFPSVIPYFIIVIFHAQRYLMLSVNILILVIL